MPPPPDFDADDLLKRLLRSLRRTADRATPEFLAQMPDPYFRDTEHEKVLVHLSAVVAARAAGMAPRMILKDPVADTWTFVHEQSYRGLLYDLVEQLPRDQPLSSAKVHTAIDGGLVLDVFRFGKDARFDPGDARQADKLEAILAYARGLGDRQAVDELTAYVAQCGADFVLAASPLRVYETWSLARQVQKTEEVACAVSPQSDPTLARISVVAANVDTRSLFERYVQHLGRMGFDITRAFLDVIHTDAGMAISLLGFVVRDPDETIGNPSGDAWRSLERALKRLRWVDDQVLDRVTAHPDLGLWRAEVLVALSRLIHPKLARENPFAFTRARIMAYLDKYDGLAADMADLFMARFGRAADPVAVKPMQEKLRARVHDEADSETALRFWGTMLDAIGYVRRTNVRRVNRFGLAMWVDPALFAHQDRPDMPFGIGFVHAGKTDGFHVRFEDLARGGVRAVHPRGPEQYVLASERLYDEVYDLALAQHLKNKDIPEGGAKAVVLVDPDGAVDASVQAFVDGLLDLLTAEGAQERLYLGPDENISPEVIEWVVARAENRGYSEPGSFMSSKPGAGINHKVYGVTSEGVTVFLEEALKAVDIDPRREPFTVKLTGGPDGDVAGNEIKILIREFGANARIVAISDGSGAGWDPDGLDHDVLLRLVEAEQPIACFDTAKLGSHGGLVPIDAPDGLRRRNRLHFEMPADAFVPAGGRPQTINGENWSQFLNDGAPSSRVIVEGANLFITPEARRHLTAAGVLIVKDSAANKCGVICSSYEVAASMLLSESAFLAIKPRFVEEVLEKLRGLARNEAVRLFEDYARDPSTSLPERAVALSRAILRTTDAIARHLAGITSDERPVVTPIIAQHLPVSLHEAAGPAFERLPLAYRDRIVAARLAAHIVYREGLEFVDAVPYDRLGARCWAYYLAEREANDLAAAIVQSDLPHAERIARLLQSGGARTALALPRDES